MPRPVRLIGVLAVLPLLALSGCAARPSSTVVASTASAVSAVPSIASTPGLPGGLDAWPGAAGEAVVCDGPVVGSTRTAPYEGEDVGSSPDAALTAAREWAGWSGAQEGFVLTGSSRDRRLYAVEVGGVPKQALIVRRGPALKGDGSRGTVLRWWLESWARCDYAELPDAVAQRDGLQLWTDAAGARQLTSHLVSFDFDASCMAGTTALDVDGPLQGAQVDKGRSPTEYIRRPPANIGARYFDDPYADHAVVPSDAVDSGYRRDGDRLWFSKDRGYAYVGAEHDAEAWPRARQPIRCA